MRPSGAAPLLQHGPLCFDTHSRRAEEQLAFHEKYHDRMARLLGGDNRDDSADVHKAPSASAAPDYWAEYTRKLEQMGIPRRGDTLRLPDEQRPPPLQQQQQQQRELSQHWGGPAAGRSPTRVPEEGVLRRLDWLAHERDEPDTTDVIDLLREVEDVLVREESRQNEGPDISLHSQPMGGATSSRALDSSQIHDPGRPMGVPPAPAVDLHSTSYHRTAPPPPPPPATAPTAAPSFQQLAQGVPVNQPPVAADWSRVSGNPQMEWYRTYYAWMMYYAQYYGALLATQQQQQQQQQLKPSRGNLDKNPTNLKKLSREYNELVAEVERLNEDPKRHASKNRNVPLSSPAVVARKNKLRQCPPSSFNGEDDTLYRSEHRYSYLRGDTTPLKRKTAQPFKAIEHRQQVNGRGEAAYVASESNEDESEGISRGKRFDPPWLPPPRHSPKKQPQEGRDASGPGGRNISWLYKYEESEAEEGSQTHTEEGVSLDRGDGRGGLGYRYDKEEERASHKPHQYTVREQSRDPVRRLSVYERKKRAMEEEKPRWCF